VKTEAIANANARQTLMGGFLMHQMLRLTPSESGPNASGPPPNPADRADGNRKQRGPRRSSASAFADKRKLDLEEDSANGELKRDRC
jgi:hypothetical protein